MVPFAENGEEIITGLFRYNELAQAFFEITDYFSVFPMLSSFGRGYAFNRST
jgi:hypothetical protein